MSFDEDTAIRAVAGGWEATVSERWNGSSGRANGGHLMALATRAVLADTGAPDPLSVAAAFLRPGRPGPAFITTATLKAGRRITFSTASLSQGGEEVLRVQAALGDLERADRPTLTYERSAAPELPPPEQCLDPLDISEQARTAAAGSVLGRLELRLPAYPRWTTGRPGGDPHLDLWLRLRDDRAADVVALVQMVDGLPPVVADVGSWSTTIELTVHVRARPAPGWLRARVDTRHVSNGLHEEEVELWDSRGVMVAQSRQLALALPFS